MIQVRNVPDALHKELVRRAEAKGVTLTAYVQSILEREVARPPIHELLSRIEAAEPVHLDRPFADYIRDGRAERLP
jgi:plasmid stability protein